MQLEYGSWENQIRMMLREAFRGVPGQFANKDLSSEFCREMRMHLPLLLPEDLQAILPRILEDLLDTHTGNSIDSEDSEFVAQHLNVLSYYPEEVYARIAETMGARSAENARNDDAELRKHKIEQYADFTREQARAILEWLLLARSWKDFEADEAFDIATAIDYWQKRANSGN